MTALVLLEVSELGVAVKLGVGVGSGEELAEKVGVACTDGVGAIDWEVSALDSGSIDVVHPAVTASSTTAIALLTNFLGSLLFMIKEP